MKMKKDIDVKKMPKANSKVTVDKKLNTIETVKILSGKYDQINQIGFELRI